MGACPTNSCCRYRDVSACVCAYTYVHIWFCLGCLHGESAVLDTLTSPVCLLGDCAVALICWLLTSPPFLCSGFQAEGLRHPCGHDWAVWAVTIGTPVFPEEF